MIGAIFLRLYIFINLNFSFKHVNNTIMIINKKISFTNCHDKKFLSWES